jgi:transposase
MDRDCFWLTDAQFARIELHLPTDTRGKPRVDDRRVISGIVHVLKSGGRYDRLAVNFLAGVCIAGPSATGYESGP